MIHFRLFGDIPSASKASLQLQTGSLSLYRVVLPKKPNRKKEQNFRKIRRDRRHNRLYNKGITSSTRRRGTFMPDMPFIPVPADESANQSMDRSHPAGEFKNKSFQKNANCQKFTEYQTMAESASPVVCKACFMTCFFTDGRQ